MALNKDSSCQREKKAKACGSSTLIYCFCKEKCHLGQGSFGKVTRGIWKESDGNTSDVAIKVIDEPDKIKYEIEILKKIKHINVVKYLGEIDTDTDSKFIVTELCDGTLLELVHNSYYLAFDERLVLHEIAEGVAHLHANKILHRDLKPGNILYSLRLENAKHRVVMKVADFGASRMVEEGKDQKTRSQTKAGYSLQFRPFGTTGWIAPEFLNAATHYTFRGDIFPMGLIFAFTLCNGRHPYGGDEDAESRDERIKNKQPILSTIAFELKKRKDASFELIQRMLATMPEGRLSAKEVLQHEFFQSSNADQPDEPTAQQNPSSTELIQQQSLIEPWMEELLDEFSSEGNAQQNPQKGEELRELCERKELDATAFSRFCDLVGDKEAVSDHRAGIADPFGFTSPLMVLCLCNQSASLDRCIEILLQQPYVDFNQTNEQGETALMSLCHFSKSDKIMQVINLLIDKDPDLLMRTDIHGSNALMHLCKGSQSDYIVEIAELFISKGVSVNYANEDGFTALMFLCRSSESNKIVQMVQLLIENGAKLNMKDNGFMSALMWLCWASRNEQIVKVAEILVKKDVDWRQKGGEGLNVLMYLCKYSVSDKIVELAKLFINGAGGEGIGVNRLDSHNFNALMWLCWFSKNDKIVQVAELLIAENINVTQKNADGRDVAFFIADNRNLPPETKRKLNSLISPHKCALM